MIRGITGPDVGDVFSLDRWKSQLAFVLGAFLVAGAALAGDFEFDNGLKGSWTVNASIGTTMRTAKQDPMLYGIANGLAHAAGNVPGRAVSVTLDDGELNYRRGDLVSTPVKVVGEVELKWQDWGAFIRGKAWYDFTLENSDVYHGHFNTGYQADAPLSDHNFPSLAKFKGLALLDAYVLRNWNLGENRALNVRVGNQVLNWGESQFIPGISGFNPIDVAAIRRPGTLTKESLLPFPLAYANFGVGKGLSLEAFYQLKWERTVIDQCGTFFSVSDPICPGGTTNQPFNQGIADFEAFNGITKGPFTGFTAIVDRRPDKTPKNSGQFGIAAHYFADALNGTDFGFYFVNYHTRTPVASWTNIPSRAGSIYSGVLPSAAPISYLLDYSAEDIKLFGVSASSELGPFALTAELSYYKDFPVGVNSTDIGQYITSRGTQGPLRFTRTYGDYVRGYDLFNKTQFQLGASRIINQVAGADAMSLAGEVGMQRWGGLPDPATGMRYGGAASFVGQPHPAYTAGPLSSLAACQGALTAAGADSRNCDFSGYATRFAWGYRLTAALSYLAAVGGWDFIPRIAWAHDVKGYSADNIFLQDRKTLGIGAAFTRRYGAYRYTADLSYTTYPHPAIWDPARDRDFASASLAVAF